MAMDNWIDTGKETRVSHRMTKPTKWPVRPAKTQISLGIRPVWSESSLAAWRKLGSLATNWVHGKASDQTGWMPKLIWVFTGHKCRFWFCHEAAQVNNMKYYTVKIQKILKYEKIAVIILKFEQCDFTIE